MVAAVIAIVLAATFLRQVGVPRAHTIWAEDGHVFVQCVYDRGPLAAGCLFSSFAGYLHTVPRLAAAAVTVGDQASLPFRLVFMAGILAAVAAALAALAIAEATSSAAAGLLAGAGMALVYPAGLEVSGNLANLHYVLLAASVVVVVSSWFGRRPRLPDLLLLAGTAVTSPFGPLLVPLAIVARVRRTPRAGLMFGVILGASMVQVAAIVLSARVVPARDPLTLRQILDGTMIRVVWRGWFGPTHGIWNVAIPTTLAGLLLGLAVVKGEAHGWAARALPIFAVLTLPFAGLVVFWLSADLNRSLSPIRYVYAPTSLSVAAIALAAGLLALRIADRRPLSRLPLPRLVAETSAGSLLLGTLLISLGIGFASTFRMATEMSGGPDVAAQIEQQRGQCVAGAPFIHVTTSPLMRGPQIWYVEIPCGDIAGMP
jgi:hypothetical protein